MSVTKIGKFAIQLNDDQSISIFHYKRGKIIIKPRSSNSLTVDILSDSKKQEASQRPIYPRII